MRRILLAFLAIAFVALPAAVPARASIVINEIMYNSNFSPDVEWVELYNTGPAGQNVTDWYMLDNSSAHPKCYLVGTLGAGQYLVVASDTAYFRARYPGVTNVNPKPFDAGGLGFGLGNSSDQVRIYDDEGLLRDSVGYASSGNWPTEPAGHGPSLELVNPFLENTIGTNWLGSTMTGGTPGAANSVYAANAAPVCDNGSRSIDLPRSTDAVTVKVRALDPENHLASVQLFVNTGTGYVAQSMYDDGLHGDGAAGDSVYGAVITAKPTGTVVKYYAKATDNLGQYNTYPDGAPDLDYHAYTVGYTPPHVVVNEIVADNVAGILNDVGLHSDWLELYNPGTSALDVGGMYLTDNRSNGNKWMIHYGTTIAAGGHLVFWADDDTLAGPMHTNFKFSNDGEEVGIFTAQDFGNVEINGWKFGPVGADVAVGYKPDFSGVPVAGIRTFPDYLATPTPAATNNTSGYYSPVCINEFQTTSAVGGIDDWIEFYNRGASTFDLSGAYLSDNRTNNTKYQFPAGTTLQAGHFMLLNETQFGFNLGTTGEVIVFTAADSLSGLDFYDFVDEHADTSEGRLPDGMGRWAKFHPTTLGSSNVGALAVGPTAPFAGVLGAVAVVPNPCVGHAEISFVLGQRAAVTAAVYDPAGRRVRTLHRGTLGAGRFALLWDGRDEGGAPVASGLYFVRIATPTASRSGRVMLLK